MTLVAGVDSSTQSTKVEIRDLETGRVVGRGAAPHPDTMDPHHPGRSEADPDTWWRALSLAFDHAFRDGRQRGSMDDAEPIAAISVAGQQHGMVALDAERRVIRPAKLWNDTETAPDAGWLLKQRPDGASSWVDACGSVPVAAFTIAKLSWLHRSEPDSWASMAHIVLPHDWLTFRLTGRLVTDRGDASGTGYWSAATGEYCFDLLSIVDKDRDWRGVVPQVLSSHDQAGFVTAAAADHLGARLAGAIVAPGTGDNMAVALGVGLSPGDAVISFGTSVTAFAVSDQPVRDPSGSTAGFADATGRHLPLVCLLNGTKVLKAMQGLLGLSDDAAGHAAFDALALAAAPGSGGVTLLPYFDGERTPNLPKATGALTGLRSDVSREQVARAAVEGVVCGALDALDSLRRHTEVTGRVVLVGGGARSQAIRQVMSGLADVTVAVPDDLDGSVGSAAAGAAVQAAMVLSGETAETVVDRWGLGNSAVVTPMAEVDDRHARAVRDQYAGVRDRFLI